MLHDPVYMILYVQVLTPLTIHTTVSLIVVVYLLTHNLCSNIASYENYKLHELDSYQKKHYPYQQD